MPISESNAAISMAASFFVRTITAFGSRPSRVASRLRRWRSFTGQTSFNSPETNLASLMEAMPGQLAKSRALPFSKRFSTIAGAPSENWDFVFSVVGFNDRLLVGGGGEFNLD